MRTSEFIASPEQWADCKAIMAMCKRVTQPIRAGETSWKKISTYRYESGDGATHRYAGSNAVESNWLSHPGPNPPGEAESRPGSTQHGTSPGPVLQRMVDLDVQARRHSSHGRSLKSRRRKPHPRR